MQKKIAVLVFVFFMLKGLEAQQAPVKPGWVFHSVNQAGLLQGESIGALGLQSVNGFERNNFFGGLGLGLDYYRFKSLPVFADLRKYFGKTKDQFFIYTDAGLNFVWEKKTKTLNYTEKYNPGFYGNAGIGFRTGLKHGNGFVLSAGYSYKRVNNRQQTNICGIIGPCYIQTDLYRYNLNRLIIQAGWVF